MFEVSIIIPFYNAETYLEDCIKSVIKSSDFLKNEVILIDDGSTDQSSTVAEYFVERYPNINMYHYQNEGLSTARNHGLAHATGKYIFFLDSDDFIAEDYVSKLHMAAVLSKSDIVFAGFSRVTEYGRDSKPVIRKILNQDQVVSGCDYLDMRMKLGDWHNQVWCALYCRDFLQANRLRFDTQVFLYEDILFTNVSLLCAKRVSAISEYGYYYRVHSHSLVHDGPQENDIIKSLFVLKKIKNIYNGLDETKKKVFGRVLFEHISMTLYYIGVVNPEKKKIYYHALKETEIFKILRFSIRRPKDVVKYLIFRYAIHLYYPLVKKDQKDENVQPNTELSRGR